MSKSEIDLALQKSMEKYFGKKNTQNDTKQIPQMVINEQIPEHSSKQYLTAEGNVTTIGEACDLIRTLLNTAWGSNWGELTDVTSRGDDANKITLPLITYNTNLREVAQGTNVKPQQMQIVNEVVNGKNTGDAFKVYKQAFDCIVEFDFYHQNANGADELMNKFEEIMVNYAGFLKKNGVQELYFLKEIPSTYSLNYLRDIPMKCLLYYFRIERTHTVRVSTILKIEENIKLQNEKANETTTNIITYKEEESNVKFK